VAKRADRAGIAYDRLNAGEKRFITRGVWFYPWIKGSTLFTGTPIVEHPYKMASSVPGAARAEAPGEHPGRAARLRAGPHPARKGRHPYVTDFSTFSPFATGADVLDAVTHPAKLAGFLNPVGCRAAA
jgi:hypothetical protein